MHGIVYVPESEAPSDPLEVEGKYFVLLPYLRTAIVRSLHVYGWGKRCQYLAWRFGSEQWFADYCVPLLQ